MPSGSGTPKLKMLRCGIYTRLACLGYDDEWQVPIEAQRDACERFIEVQPGWSVLDERYDDPGCSGANLKRPAFQRLLADVDARRMDVLVVQRMDRITRSFLDLVMVMERVLAAGVEVACVSSNFRTTDPFGRFALGMIRSLAQKMPVALEDHRRPARGRR